MRVTRAFGPGEVDEGEAGGEDSGWVLPCVSFGLVVAYNLLKNRTHVPLALVHAQHLDSHHSMAAAALAVRQGSKYLAVHLAQA